MITDKVYIIKPEHLLESPRTSIEEIFYLEVYRDREYWPAKIMNNRSKKDGEKNWFDKSLDAISSKTYRPQSATEVTEFIEDYFLPKIMSGAKNVQHKLTRSGVISFLESDLNYSALQYKEDCFKRNEAYNEYQSILENESPKVWDCYQQHSPLQQTAMREYILNMTNSEQRTLCDEINNTVKEGRAEKNNHSKRICRIKEKFIDELLSR